jgi:hypothetical protein
MIKAKPAFTVLLTVALLGIAACGNDGDEGGGGANESGEPILIKTHVAPLNAEGETFGEIVSGSTIGDSAFCAGGKFIDGPVEPPERSVERSFRCPGGVLTISFTSTPPGVPQRSDWEVVTGLGDFEGLSGGGQMRAVSESKGGEGRETFTGTVTR